MPGQAGSPFKPVSLPYKDFLTVLRNSTNRSTGYLQDRRYHNTLESLGLLDKSGSGLNAVGKLLANAIHQNHHDFAALLFDCVSKEFPQIVASLMEGYTETPKRLRDRLYKSTRYSKNTIKNVISYLEQSKALQPTTSYVVSPNVQDNYVTLLVTRYQQQQHQRAIKEEVIDHIVNAFHATRKSAIEIVDDMVQRGKLFHSGGSNLYLVLPDRK
jgi:hypothetical protein